LREPFFSFFVKDELIRLYGEDAVDRQGLTVTTTLDPDLQAQATQIVSERVVQNTKNWNAGNAALVAVDPRSGHVLAYVGGADFASSQVDILNNNRQPGSTIKPLIYYSAFTQGFSPDTLVADWAEDFGGGYRPLDYGGRAGGGAVTLRTALAASLNIPAVRVLRAVGIPRATDNLQKMGFPIDPTYHYTLPLGLGAVEVRPLDMAQSYTVMANGGRKQDVSPILKVVDHTGKVLLDRTKSEPGEQVLDVQAVAAVDAILSDYAVKRSIYPSAWFNNYTLQDRPAAAKTGTSSGPKDAWTIGYTPQLLTVVWTGNTNGADLKNNADGITIAAPIWHDFMTAALVGQPIIPFPEYEKPKLDAQHRAIDRGIRLGGQSSGSATPQATAPAVTPTAILDPAVVPATP
jgi:penicillin-binding protein 1A